MIRNPVDAGVQAVVQLSEHYANTDTFETSTKERLELNLIGFQAQQRPLFQRQPIRTEAAISDQSESKIFQRAPSTVGG